MMTVKTKGPRPRKTVEFNTLPGNDETDLCELRFFELEEGKALNYKPNHGKHIPHIPGQRYIAAADIGGYL